MWLERAPLRFLKSSNLNNVENRSELDQESWGTYHSLIDITPALPSHIIASLKSAYRKNFSQSYNII